ncbi:MAG: ABC transporter permease [Bacteroidota bacterium]
MTPTPDNHPPSLAIKIFSWFCKPDYHGDIEGDLLEHFHSNIEEKGSKQARLLFWFDVLLLFRPGIIRPLFTRNFFNHPTMFKQYFKISWRHLIKNKAYSFLNISGLAIGMAVVILIGLWLTDELSYNKYHDNYDKIARVLQNQKFADGVKTWFNQAKQLGPELRDNYGSNFKYVSMASWVGGHALTYGDKTLSQQGIFMEAVAPEMLTLKMISGSRNALEDPYSILISERAAEAIFGEKNPINESLKLDNEDLVKVGGVYEVLPDNSSFDGVHFFASWELYEKKQPAWVGWGNSWFQTVVQVADNVDIETASLAIKDAKLKNIDEESGARRQPVLFLHPMSDWHLRSKFVEGEQIGGRIEYVWLYGTIGFFVLLLACINFMNLSTARSEKRAMEIGVRKTLGSQRSQIIKQFFTESILISSLAFVFSILLVYLMMPFFNEVAGKEITRWWANPNFWLLCLGFTLLTGLLAGSYPALFLSSFLPVKVLKGSVKTGRGASIPRKVMVTIQFVVSIVLINGTIVVYKQIQFAKDRPIGYDQSRLLSSYITTDEINKHFDRFRNDLFQTGVVEEVAKSENLITRTFTTNSGLDWQGKDPEMEEEFVTMRVSHEFGKTIDWEIIKGRDFSKEFPTDSLGLVVNEAAVKYMGFDDPIGQQIQWGEDEVYHIIGVTKDMITQSTYRPTRQMFFFIDYNRSNVATLKLKPSFTSSDIAKIEAVFKTYDPVTPFSYRFMDEDYARKFANAERVGKLAGFFTILAVLISCLGLFGMIAFVAERRTKEIGIRKVLGASVLSLWQLLTKEFIFLVCIAGLLAVPIAYHYMSKWLSNFEYRIDLSVQIFVIAFILAILLTLLTISIQVLRAAMANPVKSIKSTV